MVRGDRGVSVYLSDVIIGSVTLNLVLHVPLLPLLRLLLCLPSGSRRTQDGHLVQLEELLTQAVLQVLVQLAAGRKKIN